MKILVTVHGFLTPSMTFVYNQIKAYEGKGHSVKVIACEVINSDLFPFPDIVHIPIEKDFSYYVSKAKRGTGYSHTLYNRPFSKGFEKEVMDFAPDIIHVQFGLQLVRVFPVLREKGIPVVTTFHGYDASRYLRNKLYVRQLKKILNQSGFYATTVSLDMKKRLVKTGIDGSKVYVDYLGVDTDYFKPSNKGKKTVGKTFLQVSNFVEKKGHQYTIEAFAKYLKETGGKDSRLVLAGEGALLGKMKKLAKELGISKNVDFPGLANRKKVRDLMDEADFFVHHSVTGKDGDMEGLPTVIMEAMAMCLPIISTFHAGIPELVSEPEQGILVPERDVDSLAEAFANIRSCTAENSRDMIISKFNLYKNTGNILEIFEQIVNGH